MMPAEIITSPIFVFVALGLLAFSLFLIIFVFKRLADQYQKLETEKQALEQRISQEKQVVLDTARKEADKIIAEAEDLVKQYVGSTELVTSQMRAKFQSGFDEMIIGEKGKLTDLFGLLRKEAEKEFDNSKNEYHKMAESLKKGIEQELENYRAERQKGIREESLEYARQFTKKVLGKALTYEDHERIILDAFESLKNTT